MTRKLQYVMSGLILQNPRLTKPWSMKLFSSKSSHPKSKGLLCMPGTPCATAQLNNTPQFLHWVCSSFWGHSHFGCCRKVFLEGVLWRQINLPHNMYDCFLENAKKILKFWTNSEFFKIIYETASPIRNPR